MSTTIGVQRIGKYELWERLGQGSISEVWKAYDTQQHHIVAIKLLLTQIHQAHDYESRFMRVAELVSSLHHPNIAQVRDAYMLPARPIGQARSTLAYIVSEHIEGQTLGDYIRTLTRTGALPPSADIVRFFTGIGLALDYAHQHNIIHGNLKPTNILLSHQHAAIHGEAEPILTDFGLAQLLGYTNNTLARRSIDTMLYMSPEQAKGEAGDQSGDIYALGILLYLMYTGVFPFQGNRPIALLTQHVSATPLVPTRINPNIPSQLSDIIMQCLSKDPEQRFTSATALTVALARALNIPLPQRLSMTAQITEEIQAAIATTAERPTTPVLSLPQHTSVPASTPDISNSIKMEIPPSNGRENSMTDAGATSEATATIIQQETSTATEKKTRKKFVILLSIFLLIIFLASAVVAFFVFAHYTFPNLLPSRPAMHERLGLFMEPVQGAGKNNVLF